MRKLTRSQAAPFLILAAVAIAAIFIPSLPNFNGDGKYNSADIAWMIVATALVFLMTPGLAFFYGGMVHRKNVISTMIKSFVAAGVVSILWVFIGYGLCIGAVVGLVAITPGAGYVAIPQSIFIGVVAAIISNAAVYYRSRSRLDDTLDVFPCHGIGGMTGILLTGVFASTTVNAAGANGLFYGGYEFFFTQFKAMSIVAAYNLSEQETWFAGYPDLSKFNLKNMLPIEVWLLVAGYNEWKKSSQ